MSQLDDSFLDNEEVAETTIEVVTEPVETQEVTQEAEAPQEAEQEATPEVETTSTEKEPWTLTAVMDERDKRQKANTERDEWKAKFEATQTPEKDISVFEDEEGFKNQERQKIQEDLRNNSLNMSEAFADTVFGEEKVAAAKEWFKAEGVKSPFAVNKFQEAKLPFHAIVELYDQEQARSNPDAFKAQLRAEILEELKSDTKPKPESITPSLASSSSAGQDSNAATESFEDMLGD